MFESINQMLLRHGDQCVRACQSKTRSIAFVCLHAQYKSELKYAHGFGSNLAIDILLLRCIYIYIFFGVAYFDDGHDDDDDDDDDDEMQHNMRSVNGKSLLQYWRFCLDAPSMPCVLLLALFRLITLNRSLWRISTSPVFFPWVCW